MDLDDGHRRAGRAADVSAMTAAAWRDRLGPVGLWISNRDLAHGPDARVVARTTEAFGLRTLWVSGGIRPSLIGVVDELLGATKDLVVATGVTNIWTQPAAGLAAEVDQIESTFPGRFLLGLGVSHPEFLAAKGREPSAPTLASMSRYLDDLDGFGIDAGCRVLAALGPAMMRLASERAVGCHPYLSTPDHSARARSAVPEGLVAPAQAALVMNDPADAREAARAFLGNYAQYENYVRHWRRMGFDDDDVRRPLSDRLVDALVAHGTVDDVVARVHAHLAAGADHVAVQLLPKEVSPQTLEELLAALSQC